ncbi:MAG: aminotransferase class V-fold PLP-dependent enzyme, partial [Calditrichia bacterium]
EAGTPNTIGVIAMAKSLQTLMDIGMDKVAEHEKQLTRHMLTRMKEIPSIEIYGSADPEVVDNRLGVIALNVQGLPHALTAAILNYEGGVGVRNGCFCAHPYIKMLLQLDDETSKKLEQQMLEGDRSNLPGAVRASFGLYNSIPEIDRFIEILKKVVNGKYEGKYILNKKEGAYYPEGYVQNFQNYLTI